MIILFSPFINYRHDNEFNESERRMKNENRATRYRTIDISK